MHTHSIYMNFFLGHLTWVNHITLCPSCAWFLMYPEFSYDTLSSYRARTPHTKHEIYSNKFIYFHTKRSFWMAFSDYTSARLNANWNGKTRNQRISHIACNWFKAYFSHKAVQIHVPKSTENKVLWHFFYLSRSYTFSSHCSAVVPLSILPVWQRCSFHAEQNTFHDGIHFGYDKDALFMQFN